MNNGTFNSVLRGWKGKRIRRVSGMLSDAFFV